MIESTIHEGDHGTDVIDHELVPVTDVINHEVARVTADAGHEVARVTADVNQEVVHATDGGNHVVLLVIEPITVHGVALETENLTPKKISLQEGGVLRLRQESLGHGQEVDHVNDLVVNKVARGLLLRSK